MFEWRKRDILRAQVGFNFVSVSDSPQLQLDMILPSLQQLLSQHHSQQQQQQQHHSQQQHFKQHQNGEEHVGQFAPSIVPPHPMAGNHQKR